MRTLRSVRGSCGVRRNASTNVQSKGEERTHQERFQPSQTSWAVRQLHQATPAPIYIEHTGGDADDDDDDDDDTVIGWLTIKNWFVPAKSA